MNIRTEKGTEHLEWSKKRALEYVERGDFAGAWTSMLGDLSSNDELKNHPALELGTMLLFAGNLSNKESMKKFIEDFA